MSIEQGIKTSSIAIILKWKVSTEIIGSVYYEDNFNEGECVALLNLSESSLLLYCTFSGIIAEIILDRNPL